MIYAYAIRISAIQIWKPPQTGPVLEIIFSRLLQLHSRPLHVPFSVRVTFNLRTTIQAGSRLRRVAPWERYCFISSSSKRPRSYREPLASTLFPCARTKAALHEAAERKTNPRACLELHDLYTLQCRGMVSTGFQSLHRSLVFQQQ